MSHLRQTFLCDRISCRWLLLRQKISQIYEISVVHVLEWKYTEMVSTTPREPCPMRGRALCNTVRADNVTVVA